KGDQEHAYENDRRQSLKSRGDEGDDHAAADSLLVGHHIGRDNGLTVPRSYCVQHAINEGQQSKRERAGERVVGLERLDAHGERPLQALLLVEHPGEQAPKRPWRLKRRGGGRAKRWRRPWSNLGRGERTDRLKLSLCGGRGQKEGETCEQNYVGKAGSHARHKCESLHFTVAVWANCDPKLEFGPSWLKKDSVKALVSAAVSGSGRVMSAVQPLGSAPVKVTGFSVAKPNATKKDGS